MLFHNHLFPSPGIERMDYFWAVTPVVLATVSSSSIIAGSSNWLKVLSERKSKRPVACYT